MTVETEQPLCEVCIRVCERMAEVYGAPLPHRLLSLGDPNRGWHVTLNATREDAPGIDAFTAVVNWGGFPAGILTPYGSTLAAGAAANVETFLEWLPAAVRGGEGEKQG